LKQVTIADKQKDNNVNSGKIINMTVLSATIAAGTDITAVMPENNTKISSLRQRTKSGPAHQR